MVAAMIVGDGIAGVLRVSQQLLAKPGQVIRRILNRHSISLSDFAACELWRRSRLRQVKYLNNIVEQDHRNVKRLTCPGLGFGSFWTARRTLAGYEAMTMIRKGRVRNIGGRDIKAQAKFIAALFALAA
jgi:transposase-like protein